MGSDEEILGIFQDKLDEHYVSHYKRKDTDKPEFTLADLVGKTLVSGRLIKNPRSYDPECESPNPEYFTVIELTGNSVLLTEMWGDMECGHLEAYLFDGKRVLHSDSLFQ